MLTPSVFDNRITNVIITEETNESETTENIAEVVASPSTNVTKGNGKRSSSTKKRKGKKRRK
jgi:hypothetical protein